LIRFNHELAEAIGIDVNNLDATELAIVFSGNHIPPGAEPLAMAYAGHQFGNFVPQLGDGRAVLLGEVTDSNGDSLGIHLKGSGQTAFSRNGDGRAALGPVLREYLVSEAMARLGVPTTRALAAVTTGEKVSRESLLPGGVITRVASSFVRVGTFQFFMARDDLNSVQALADFVIEHNYPHLREADQTYAELLKAIVDAQAKLIAQWMQLGFIHGVMNTDNMSVAGETIDYGPCAFMDTYRHEQVYSYIDRTGRYAYNNQPSIGLWNLTRLAESLLPLLANEPDDAVQIAQDILNKYPAGYEHYWLNGMRSKFGLTDRPDAAVTDDDRALIEALFDIMATGEADFTLTFYSLSKLLSQPSDLDAVLRDLFTNKEQLDAWLAKWRERLDHEDSTDEQRQAAMQTVNPVYIPRNHQIEAAIRAAEDQGDFSVFHDLHEVLQNPYEYRAGKDDYLQPPQPHEEVRQTFCGT
jgi:uncharacterized protein YdiU (UPF0061 family)